MEMGNASYGYVVLHCIMSNCIKALKMQVYVHVLFSLMIYIVLCLFSVDVYHTKHM